VTDHFNRQSGLNKTNGMFFFRENISEGFVVNFMHIISKVKRCFGQITAVSSQFKCLSEPADRQSNRFVRVSETYVLTYWPVQLPE
jgi:hypothetical protein